MRRLRSGPSEAPAARPRQRLSQVDMAYDILQKSRTPLHISELLARIQATFHVAVDRESLVSSLSKKVARGDRFTRPAKNTFGLRSQEAPPCACLALMDESCSLLCMHIREEIHRAISIPPRRTPSARAPP